MTALGSVRLEAIEKRYGSFAALESLDLDIRPNEFFALLGPSGSGKTTTLRLIAGLEEPTAGRIYIDRQDVTEAGPGERDIAMVFQSYALYPHMTVGENIGFPLRMSRVPRAEIEGLVREAAAKVQIERLLDRRPGQLSGGQQQRCALARAIVRKPRLFLLDEPLSNLDAKLRLETRVELKQLQHSLNVTAIYVTHDQEEAMTLADRMAIFLNGRIVQVGTPESVFDRPETIDVAGFIGSPPMNLIDAHFDGEVVRVDGQRVPIEGRVRGDPRPVTIGIRPGHLQVAADGLPATVYVTELLGEATLVNLKLGQQIVKMRVLGKSRLKDGEAVRIGLDPAQVHVFDSETRRRIDLNR